MRKILYAILAYLCGAVGVADCAGDCPFQECDCDGITISCEDKGLKTLPPLVTTNDTGYLTLLLDGNQITRIQSGSLPSGLVELSLLNNPIEIIDDNAFEESFNTLETLMLSTVKFTRIPNAFLRLNNLTMLTLYGANILDWNVDAIKKTGQTLVTLFLEEVGLETWPDWLQNFSHLTQLTIAGSSIAFIPNGAFDLLTNRLEALYLYSNSLTAIPEAISKLTALQVLNLRNNTISDLIWLPRASRLLALSLDTNNISNASHLSEALLPFGDSLNNLYLQENHLTTIPNLTFLSKVGSLDFSSNIISDINSGAVHPNVFALNFGYNSLPGIPRMMSGLKSITDFVLPANSITNIHDVEFPPNTVRVELALNLITELTDTSFPQNSNIQFLHLNDNPLIRISVLAFNNIRHLIELNLRNTKLTRLPMALASLTSLIVMDFTNNTDLICTCTEKSLESWVTSLLPTNVAGTCGQTSIYDFFVNLSPACPPQ